MPGEHGQCTIEAISRLSGNSTENGPETQSTDTFAIGVAMGLTASIMINLSQNLLADIKEDEKPLVRWIWLLVWFVSIVTNFAAFSFAPAGVLAGLEGAQFATNFVFFFLWKRDKIYRKTNSLIPTPRGWRNLIGVIIVCGGIVLPALASNSGDAEFDAESIKCMWTRPRRIIFYSATLSLALTAALIYIYYRNGVFTGTNPTKNESRLDIFLYSFVAGSIGQTAVINAKSISELFGLIYNGKFETLTDPILYVTIVLVTVGFGGWIKLLASGPKYFPSSYALTTLQAAYIVIGSVGSTIFFEEIDAMDRLGTIQYFVGMACVVLGAMVMIPPPTPPSSHIYIACTTVALYHPQHILAPRSPIYEGGPVLRSIKV